MEDLIIPICIFLYFLVVLIILLNKNNESKVFIYSVLISILGIVIFTTLQLNVSSYDLSMQSQNDYNDKRLSFRIIIFSYFLSIILNLFAKKKTALNYITLFVQSIIFIVFITLNIIALSFNL